MEIKLPLIKFSYELRISVVCELVFHFPPINFLSFMQNYDARKEFHFDRYNFEFVCLNVQKSEMFMGIGIGT